MAEKLEPVTEFSSLRAGVVVVVKHCLQCSSDHRGITLRLIRDPHPDSPFWSFAPNCSYAKGISRRTIREGRAYRVVDGLDPAADASDSAILRECARLHAANHRLVRP